LIWPEYKKGPNYYPAQAKSGVPKPNFYPGVFVL